MIPVRMFPRGRKGKRDWDLQNLLELQQYKNLHHLINNHKIPLVHLNQSKILKNTSQIEWIRKDILEDVVKEDESVAAEEFWAELGLEEGG